MQSQARGFLHDIQTQCLTDASQTCYQCILGFGEVTSLDGSCLRAADNTRVDNFMLICQQDMAVETDRSKPPLSKSDMLHDNQPSLFLTQSYYRNINLRDVRGASRK